MRDPATWTVPEVLVWIVESSPAAGPSVQPLRALGDRLAVAGLDVTAVRSRVQEKHVDSSLVNLSLADALRATDPGEAIRYYEAALAIHPRSAAAHNGLAVTLANFERRHEVVGQYEQSLMLAPDAAATHNDLAHELSKDRPIASIWCVQTPISRSRLASKSVVSGKIAPHLAPP
jgi:tetratricopeptide (TPR) repeat protein